MSGHKSPDQKPTGQFPPNIKRDTRYIQCNDNTFDRQKNICLQPLIQPGIQPILQTNIQPIQVMQSNTTLNAMNQFNTLPIKTNQPIHQQLLLNTFENKKKSGIFGQKEMITNINDNNLNLNKNCKTIFTYEKNTKKNLNKKPDNLISHLQNYDSMNKKKKDIIQKTIMAPIEEKKSTIINTKTLNMPTSTKTVINKFTDSSEKLFCKNTQNLSNVIKNINDNKEEVKQIKPEKPTPPRKFFSTGLKEKCVFKNYLPIDRLYGKPDVIDYLDDYHMPVLELHPAADNNTTGIKDEIKQEESLKNQAKSKINDIDKLDLYEFRSDDYDTNQFEGNDHLIYDENYSSENHKSYTKMNKKRTIRSSSMCMTPQTDTIILPYKSNASKKKNAQRKRALSSASKLSNVSQGESTIPYSWAFSGQDFKILVDDIKSSYHVPIFGGNNSYFTLESVQPNSNEQIPTESVSLEVPSWRIKSYTPDQHIQTSENMDEEVILKRHLKMELEEKRRKRWDFQRIREQLNNEKLRQNQERRSSGGIRQNKGSKIITGSICEEIPSTLHPSPDDIFSIEINDTLPVTAFGECIPDLPPRNFQLPSSWTRPDHHSKTHSTPKKKFKSDKSEEE